MTVHMSEDEFRSPSRSYSRMRPSSPTSSPTNTAVSSEQASRATALGRELLDVDEWLVALFTRESGED
jgi:hypothetical protein